MREPPLMASLYLPTNQVVVGQGFVVGVLARSPLSLATAVTTGLKTRKKFNGSLPALAAVIVIESGPNS